MSEYVVMKNLCYGSDCEFVDWICNFNRYYAEYVGYAWSTNWIFEVKDKGEVMYYDLVMGVLFFIVFWGWMWVEFEKEFRAYGWSSFRDAEMV